jgi:hypothetical protein
MMPTLSDLQQFAADKTSLPQSWWSCICTYCAAKVVRQFGGKVMGFFVDENPGARICRDPCDGGPTMSGHDFALVDGRYIVDTWAFHAHVRLIPKPVFDLEEKKDRELVRWFYGREASWEETYKVRGRRR